MIFSIPISNLPFPVKDWLSLIPPTALVAGLGYTAYRAFHPEGRPTSKRCNNKIRLAEGKVVDFVDLEDIAEKASLCRCWRSNNVRVPFTFNQPTPSSFSISSFQWPYCDGSHGLHNKETGDNTGPVVVKRKAPAAQ